ncbi:Uncharacterized protein M6B38_232095 [Iris pallida]|uniref:Uncharacterized protein n=1 Tax=Iris pallida TaxID=29817 RepID=A0AAX6DRC7_IRIPA|nr:Uncharacterized protein M6B38_232095 [Iris pallida]
MVLSNLKTQVVKMVLSNPKDIAENNLNITIVYYCISIPVFFIVIQSRAVMDDAMIARPYPLWLFHETTTTALAYGIYKIHLPENDQVKVAFVNVDHANMQVWKFKMVLMCFSYTF